MRRYADAVNRTLSFRYDFLRLLENCVMREDAPRSKMEILPEYSDVRLIQSFRGLPKGAEGTIVMVYPETHTYTIEFFAPITSVETVDMNMVEPSSNG